MGLTREYIPNIRHSIHEYRYISRVKGLLHRPERVGSEALAERSNSFRGVQDSLRERYISVFVDRVFYICFIPFHSSCEKETYTTHKHIVVLLVFFFQHNKEQDGYTTKAEMLIAFNIVNRTIRSLPMNNLAPWLTRLNCDFRVWVYL